MSIDEVRVRLAKQVAAAGSQRNWARRHGIALGYVCMVLNGKRQPGPAILDALNLVKKAADYAVKPL